MANLDKKKCGSCGYFKAYYTRGFCCLLREDNGICHYSNKVMKKSDSCDKWYCRRSSKDKRIKIAVNCIPEIYNKVSVLEQILREECEAEELRKEIFDIKSTDDK